MKPIRITALLTVAALLAGCANLSPDQRFAAGGLAGAATGLAVADATNSNKTGRVIGTLAGAAIGSTVAANSAQPQCRYSNGSLGPCPVGY